MANQLVQYGMSTADEDYTILQYNQGHYDHDTDDNEDTTIFIDVLPRHDYEQDMILPEYLIRDTAEIHLDSPQYNETPPPEYSTEEEYRRQEPSMSLQDIVNLLGRTRSRTRGRQARIAAAILSHSTRLSSQLGATRHSSNGPGPFVTPGSARSVQQEDELHARQREDHFVAQMAGNTRRPRPMERMPFRSPPGVHVDHLSEAGSDSHVFLQPDGRGQGGLEYVPVPAHVGSAAGAQEDDIELQRHLAAIYREQLEAMEDRVAGVAAELLAMRAATQ